MDEEQLALVEEGLNLLIKQYKKNSKEGDLQKMKAALDAQIAQALVQEAILKKEQALARTKLIWWRKEVAQMQNGAPTHPVTRALAPHLHTFNIRGEHLQAVIDGMEMDLDQTRYLDFPA